MGFKCFADGWMNMPQGNPNIPRGLEYLTMIDQLLVHQKVELLEGEMCFGTNLLWLLLVIYKECICVMW
jgi:hypothetical protein